MQCRLRICPSQALSKSAAYTRSSFKDQCLKDQRFAERFRNSTNEHMNHLWNVLALLLAFDAQIYCMILRGTNNQAL